MAGRMATAALVTLALMGGCTAEEPPLPFGPMQLMMANEVQPTADIYWGAVRFESELVDGTVVERDIRPQSEADWQRVEAAAARLGVLGQAMLDPAYAEGRGTEWAVFAQGLVDVAAEAQAAAAARDPDAVFEVGGYVYNVCQACHQVYPPANLPEGVTADDLAPQ